MESLFTNHVSRSSYGVATLPPTHVQVRPRRYIASRASSTSGSAAPTEQVKQVPPLRVVEVTRLQRKTYELKGTELSCVDVESTTDSAALDEVPSASTGNGKQPLHLRALQRIKVLLLPRGYPASVTSDYLSYQLWALPCHVTGWMSISLATSNLLRAVGIGGGALGTTAAAAAIKWVTKDGIGALGRVLVGGGLSGVFDEDPRRWRMVAELVTTSGLSLEIATALFPGNFLLLAGAGNFAKAFGKGLGRPAFRVMQTHFAAANNVGDVAAKEEVWEVVGQLLGLAGSVAVLKALEASGGGAESVVYVWAGVHSLHVSLRYRALRTLRFPFLNQKRAAALVTAHVRGATPLPGVEQANAQEPLLQDPGLVSPRLHFGARLEQLARLLPRAPAPSPTTSSTTSSSSSSNGSTPPDEAAASVGLQAVLPLYEGEAYVLAWAGGRGDVLLRQGAGGRDYVRALWQGAWLEHRGVVDASPADLAASLAAMRGAYDDLREQAEAAGWRLEETMVPAGDVRLMAAGP